jgi:hypothetical protein
VTWADRALALNPGGPDWYLVAKGVAAFAAGDNAAAADALGRGSAGGADRAIFLAAAEAMLGNAEAARAAADEVRRLMPGFDLASYMDGYMGAAPPALRSRLHDGAVRAGLGAAPAAD